MHIPVPLRERSYNIEIESGLLGTFDTLFLPHEIAVLSNETVAPLYAQQLAARLRESGHRVLEFNAPEGEGAKNLDWTNKAYDALADWGLRRNGAIVAVGGGVVGDWAGFVAATWMRGVAFVQVPTTLLAMVDSSVGGKVGVNHARAKNLIGAFHQPIRVLIDADCLQTLPPRELRAGMAEVVKYGVIADAEFFAWLEQNATKSLSLDTQVTQRIIARSCEIKAEVVGEDERESDSSGRRATLNYGHTVGHAIEATSGYGEYLHGEAISIGMCVAARLARRLGVCEGADELIARQEALFQALDLPTKMRASDGSSTRTNSDERWNALWNAMLLDKKTRDGAVNFILPTRLGDVQVVKSIGENDVRAAWGEVNN
jgi:3-dehydroquinate synthase